MWPFLLALHGHTGRGTHQEVLLLCYLQGKATKGPYRKYCGQQSLGISTPQLLVPRTREGKEEYFLVVMDHFTHYAQAYVTQSQMALKIAKALRDKFIIHCGLPKKILSDQGRNFEIVLIANLCKVRGAKKLRTTLYHPHTNSQCERFNSTLIGMLETLPLKYKSDWNSSIGVLVHAYNCTENATTGFSPYFLMYGRQPQLSVDIYPWVNP